MKTFDHTAVQGTAAAVRAHGGTAQYLAGGTTQLDLMKLDVLRPERIVDVARLRDRGPAVEDRGDWLRLDGFATMAQTAADATLRRRAPMLVESLTQAASHQIRAMATLGGNVLQRTRCGYYRDTSWTKCNRRDPGSGCAAIEGRAWAHAVLGTTSQCIAIYPGDFAQALIALDATAEIEGAGGMRMLPFAELHRIPATEPQRETNLLPDDLITGFRVAIRPWFARSRYVKVRDRASYEFALASAAVALDLDARRVRDARIAIGGGATVPWRAREAEALLRGKPVDEMLAGKAANAAYAGASVREDTRHRLELGKATLVRALLETAAMEVRHG